MLTRITKKHIEHLAHVKQAIARFEAHGATDATVSVAAIKSLLEVLDYYDMALSEAKKLEGALIQCARMARSSEQRMEEAISHTVRSRTLMQAMAKRIIAGMIANHGNHDCQPKLTDSVIACFRSEAAAAGDLAAVGLCDIALEDFDG